MLPVYAGYCFRYGLCDPGSYLVQLLIAAGATQTKLRPDVAGAPFLLFSKLADIANPKLLQGHNKLWVRFFLLAVFATMYVRDHQRPYFHEALGVDPKEYGRTVFRTTSEIARQVFPLEIDIDNPKFFALLDQLLEISDKGAAAAAKGGLSGKLAKLGTSLKAGFVFARLMMIPAKKNDLPENIRLAPSY